MNSSTDNPACSFAIETRGLAKNFGNSKILRRVDLRVRLGETLAILGPNGAGKTTLIKLLSGIMRPTGGQILIHGLAQKDHFRDARAHIGVVAHHSYLYSNLTAMENLVFYARMYGVEKHEERITTVLKQVGLEAHRHARFSTFSRGMQQRLSLARALLHRPSILLLDEPETGLDQQGLNAMWEILRHEEAERTIVFTSHSFERTLAVCDDVIILAGGRIAYQEHSCNLDLASLHQRYTECTQAVKP